MSNWQRSQGRVPQLHGQTQYNQAIQQQRPQMINGVAEDVNMDKKTLMHTAMINNGRKVQRPGQPMTMQQNQPPNQAQMMKQQQQRLLLLMHANMCQAKPGECKETPHCAEMKTLLAHIMKCMEKDCKAPHCVSSRYVLGKIK